MKTRKINIDFKNIKAEIVYHNFKNIEVKTFLLHFPEKRRVLSTLEGFKKVKFVGNHYSPPELWNFVHKNKKLYEEKIFSDLNLKFEDTAMLYTGLDIDNISIVKKEFNNIKIYAFITAGVKSNAQRIGVDIAGSIEFRKGHFKNIGTVNIIVLTNLSLTDGAMARSIITITEAKTIAFQDLDVRSSYNPSLQATGTGTDNIIVISGNKTPQITYVGGHAKIGEIMAKAVTEATKEGILKQR